MHRGAGWHSQVCTALYEGAREPVRDFVGGRADDAVIFTRTPPTRSTCSRTACRPATTVVVFETEHHAALLPWRGRAGRGPAAGARVARRRGRRGRRRPAPPLARARRCSWSPAPRTSPASSGRSPSWPRSPGAEAPGSRWTPRSSRRTGRSPSPSSASTTSRCPGTSCTPRTAPARWSAAPTGWRPRRRT